MVVLLFGFAFLYPAVHHLRCNKLYKIMMLRSQDKIKNDIELDHFATNFERMLVDKERDKALEVMFLGFLFMHRQECQASACPLRHEGELYLPSADAASQRSLFPSNDKILHQHLLNSVFLEYQRAHPNQLTAITHHSFA